MYWAKVSLVLGVVLAAGPAHADAEDDPILAVDSVSMTVGDMATSLRFYEGVLGFEKTSDVEVEGPAYARLDNLPAPRMRVVRLRLGDEHLELVEFRAPKGRPAPVTRSNDPRFQHVAIVVSDMDQAFAKLRGTDMRFISPEPQRLPDSSPETAGVRAFDFTDPDGHPLELLQFPEGKGNPRWFEPSGRLFLGIDHTTITTRNSEEAVHFYRDLLGMRVSSRSERYGPEEERLANVFGARVRLTQLRAESGPGIELLEYLTPRDDETSTSERPNDLGYEETRLVARDATAALRRVQAFERSSPVVELPDGKLGFGKAAELRDPDGHAVVVIER